MMDFWQALKAYLEIEHEKARCLQTQNPINTRKVIERIMSMMREIEKC
jgi:hypothetical protein